MTQQKKIRVAVAGMGARGMWAVQAFKEDPAFELAAIVDTLPQRVQLALEEFELRGVACFSDLASCLAEMDLDAVAIFTPDATHAELVVPALDAGKHVFVEKPLDVTAERLDAIVEADRRAGGRTFVGFNLRYAPVYAKIRALIDQGEIGQVLTIQADEFYNSGRTYFRRWNRLTAWGGGLWITKASHDFDLLYWMAGAAPAQVYARSALAYYKPRADAALYCRDCDHRQTCPDRYEVWTPPDSRTARLRALTEQATGEKPDLCLFNSDKDTFDHGMAQVGFANGVLATYTVNVVAGFSNRRMRVSGTRGTIDGDLKQSKVTLWRRDAVAPGAGAGALPGAGVPAAVEEFTVKAEGGHAGADGNILGAFAAFVRGQPAQVIRPEEASVAVRMGLAARESCATGAAVALANCPARPAPCAAHGL